MTTVKYEIDIQAPVEQVYEYYTNPSNIKETWPIFPNFTYNRNISYRSHNSEKN